jgi:ABC-2 type transport system ATP-binding protein
VLTMDGVRKSYGAVVALDDLSLQVREGEVFGLLGPNGAGKSTTINLAVGLLRPDGGHVRIDGKGTPADLSVRRAIGVAPQTLALYELLSAEENLRFFGAMYGLTGSVLRERVRWALEFVGLSERAQHRVSSYSGGMKRRLNLAAAVVHDPALILLDEPTVGVDPQSRSQIFENILRLKALGRTIIYTTHYMEEAQRLCDRVAIIDNGRLLALGTVQELLDRHGAAPRLVLQGATLEEVFLQLTGRTLRD